MPKHVITKYFGGWTASGPKPARVAPAVPNNAAVSAIVPDKERIQSKCSSSKRSR